jgi:rhodanese-related sulfurtransferase
MAEDDYAERQAKFELVSKEDAAALSKDGSVVWVDFRTEPEVAANPLPPQVRTVNLPCTRDDYSKVNMQSLYGAILEEAIVMDMDTKLATFCGIGYRAANANLKLREMGFTNVVNVGGYDDIVSLFS